MQPILIFSTAYFPLVGGAEVAVREITSRLPDTNFVLITAKLRADLPDTEQQGNVLVHRIGKGNSLDKIRLIVAGPKVAATYKPKAVWSIMASYAGFASLFFKKKNPTVPYLLTLQEGDSFAHIYARVWWCWPWFKQIFTRADYIQAISTYLANWGKSLGAISPITVVPNGIEEKLFALPSEQMRVDCAVWLKNTLAIPQSHAIIITVSRLVAKNGVEDLIKAMALLPNNMHLAIAGSGERESACKELARTLSLENRIHFLGTIQYSELPKYLSGSDVFCRPSLSEGLGNAFLEAMAMGTPIVGTLVGGIPDFLIDRKTGLVAKPRDPKSIANAIEFLFGNREVRNECVKNGVQVIMDRFRWSAIAESMQRIFTDLQNPAMRIVLATGVYPPEIGGPATYVAHLAPELEKTGAEVRVITYGDQDKIEENIIRVSRRGGVIVRYWRYLQALRRAAAGTHFIYAFDLFSTGLPALIAGKILHKPVIIRIGGDFAWEKAFNAGWTTTTLPEYYAATIRNWKEKIYLMFTAWGVHTADLLIISTPWLYEIYKKKFNLTPENVAVIENPFLDLEVKETERVKKYDIVFVGRFIALKNIETLLEAVKNSDYSVAIVGGGPDESKLIEQIKIMGLGTQVEMIKNVSPALARAYMAESRVVVLPSFSEVSPNTVLECITLHKPIICTKETGYVERFKNLITFFDPRSVAGLRTEIDRLLKNSNEYEAYEKVLQNISRHPNFVATAEAHGELFKKVLGKYI